MKTKFLFGALAAFGMLTACSSDETADAEKQTTGEGVESFVSFSIVSSNAGGTRVDSADPDAEFAEAEGNEAKIDNVVLLFYDKDGNAINVNMGSTNTNYKIITLAEGDLQGVKEPVSGTNPTQNNVEQWFQKTVAITTASSLEEAKVLAVVNANIIDGKMCNKSDVPISGSISKSVFYSATFTGEYTDNLFVMSTSVYADGTPLAVISDVAVTISDSKETAAANPATIYVERVKARAKVIDGAMDNNLYAVNLAGVGLPTQEQDKDFKIKVLGWDLNTTANGTYLFKQLSTSYTYGFVWNDPNLHRSYWENPFNQTTLSDYTTSFTPSQIGSAPGSGFKYCNPNTTLKATKVLVYTQLVNSANGEPADIATWYGNNYTLESLKTAILAASPKTVYVKTGTDDTKKSYTNVTEDYVDFRQGLGSGAADRSWMAYPILKTKLGESDITYYKNEPISTVDGSVDNFVAVTCDEAMQMLKFQKADKTNDLQGAKIWNEGKAYYFVDVEHLGGEHAMVRNHSYTIRIDGFEGLGTPIFDPDTIIPEPLLPEDDKKSYVSVTMNVLSWRIVPTQGVVFGK